MTFAQTLSRVERMPGKFVPDYSCKKFPVEMCGQGCVLQEGVEECHDTVVTSSVDVPQEVCHINPLKTCRQANFLLLDLVWTIPTTLV